MNDENYYDIDGSKYPRVTHILSEVLGEPYGAGEWYLQRGRANHACYALLARGGKFAADPQSEPWIDGWRLWRQVVQPEISKPEIRVHHSLLQYAGTLDLLCRINGKLTVVDYKNSTDWRTKYQLAAYALAYEHMWCAEIKQAAEVEINGDGRYKMQPIIKGGEFVVAKSQWISIHNVYQIKAKHGEV